MTFTIIPAGGTANAAPVMLPGYHDQTNAVFPGPGGDGLRCPVMDPIVAVMVVLLLLVCLVVMEEGEPGK